MVLLIATKFHFSFFIAAFPIYCNRFIADFYFSGLQISFNGTGKKVITLMCYSVPPTLKINKLKQEQLPSLMKEATMVNKF